jgi:phosphopantothenate synthetase
MKVTEEIIREHLPKIIEKLEKLEDWSEENLKQLLVEYNKEN